jgi:cytochrome c
MGQDRRDGRSRAILGAVGLSGQRGRRMTNWLHMHLWRRGRVVVLLVAIPGIAGAGPTWLQSQSDRQIRLASSTEMGALLFQNRCASCHATQQPGPDKFGPNLHGVFGRSAGSLPGYNYSADLRNSRIIWNAQSLDEYLADPHRGRPGDKMPYPGLSGKTDRDDLISYLEQATR